MVDGELDMVDGQYNSRIRLVESDEIGTIGLGEATIPHIGSFNNILGLDENECVRKTQATFKLGIEFSNWGRLGDSYIHPFGDFGSDMPNGIPFHHHWLKSYKMDSSQDLFSTSMEVQASKRGKFTRPLNIHNSSLAKIAYAFHLRDDNGFIESITLASGECIEGDLFIDCSGFKGVLIEGALKTGYHDWSHTLCCDRAVTVQSESVGEPLPYTRAIAQPAGWQWRIPLQHRTGNGHVYCSQHMSEDEATSILLKNLDGTALNDPKSLRFNTGRRKQLWNKNCVALGLSGGFMETLESTSIYLIQSGISKLLALFSDKHFSQINIDKYNQMIALEYERIRDFLILHYWANQRDDSEFWTACRTIKIPQYLIDKIKLYKSTGRIYRQDEELFSVSSWLAVFHGQNIVVNNYHAVVDAGDFKETQHDLKSIRNIIEKCAASIMPSHSDFIAKHCAAEH